MRTLEIPLANGRAYPVHIGSGLLGDPEIWASCLPEALVVVVSNDVVAPLYLKPLLEVLGDREVLTRVVPDGEAEKSFDNWRGLLEFLADHEARRDTCLVALGGGVIGDLVGFAAATWMRGIRFVQAPTTLLAQVDASVGGKTAINLPEGKNLVGAFHQPVAVLADIETLATLPPREYRAGLAEVVKYGAIRDDTFIDELESSTDALLGRDPATLEAVVARSVACKAKVVAEDEREQGVRAILNFGHSFGHALESVTGYRRFLHGEAVAIGMVAAAELSEARGLCEAGFADRLRALLQALRLEVTIPPDIAVADLMGRMRLDKKNLTGRRRLVLLRAPGEAFVDHGSSDDEIRRAIVACRQDPGNTT